MNCERHFERERRHRLDEKLADSAVEIAPEQPLAGSFGALDAPFLTQVLRPRLFVRDVVADSHPLAATPADRQAL